VNPGDKAAEARFKEVNAAYDVLSDADKRKKYDPTARTGSTRRRSRRHALRAAAATSTTFLGPGRGFAYALKGDASGQYLWLRAPRSPRNLNADSRSRSR
jgi:curved DNA-binding protein CbpA